MGQKISRGVENCEQMKTIIIIIYEHELADEQSLGRSPSGWLRCQCAGSNYTHTHSRDKRYASEVFAS